MKIVHGLGALAAVLLVAPASRAVDASVVDDIEATCDLFAFCGRVDAATCLPESVEQLELFEDMRELEECDAAFLRGIEEFACTGDVNICNDADVLCDLDLYEFEAGRCLDAAAEHDGDGDGVAIIDDADDADPCVPELDTDACEEESTQRQNGRDPTGCSAGPSLSSIGSFALLLLFSVRARRRNRR